MGQCFEDIVDKLKKTTVYTSVREIIHDRLHRIKQHISPCEHQWSIAGVYRRRCLQCGLYQIFINSKSRTTSSWKSLGYIDRRSKIDHCGISSNHE